MTVRTGEVVRMRLAAHLPGADNTTVWADPRSRSQIEFAPLRAKSRSGEVAAELEECVRAGAVDGFVLVPHLTPGGLDEFVDRVVPLLQERGVFRTEYRGTTLRSHLGLPEPG